MLDWFMVKLLIAFIFSLEETKQEKKKCRKHKAILCAISRATFFLEVGDCTRCCCWVYKSQQYGLPV